MEKKKIYEANIAGKKSVFFWCRGCTTSHSFDPLKIKWNENNYNPTISNSIFIINRDIKCHSVIKDGKIVYLEETEHDLRGKEIDLDEFYH